MSTLNIGWKFQLLSEQLLIVLLNMGQVRILPAHYVIWHTVEKWRSTCYTKWSMVQAFTWDENFGTSHNCLSTGWRLLISAQYSTSRHTPCSLCCNMEYCRVEKHMLYDLLGVRSFKSSHNWAQDLQLGVGVARVWTLSNYLYLYLYSTQVYQDTSNGHFYTQLSPQWCYMEYWSEVDNTMFLNGIVFV